MYGVRSHAHPTCYTPTGAPQQRCASIGFVFVMCLFRDNRTVKASCPAAIYDVSHEPICHLGFTRQAKTGRGGSLKMRSYMKCEEQDEGWESGGEV